MINQYIPYDTLTSNLEQAYLNNLKAKRIAAEELDRLGNSFKTISEQLTELQQQLIQSKPQLGCKVKTVAA